MRAALSAVVVSRDMVGPVWPADPTDRNRSLARGDNRTVGRGFNRKFVWTGWTGWTLWTGEEDERDVTKGTGGRTGVKVIIIISWAGEMSVKVGTNRANGTNGDGLWAMADGQWGDGGEKRSEGKGTGASG